jgi:Spy/CpxP family protein refolding chaperone
MRIRSTHLFALGFAATWLTLGAFASEATAKCRSGYCSRSMEDRHERMAEVLSEKLDLNDETRAKVDAITEKSRAEAKEIRDALRKARGEMRTLLDQDEPNEKAILKQADAIARLEADAHKRRLKTMLEIRALLTPEQRAKLTSMRRERLGKMFRPILDTCEKDIASHCSGIEPGPELMQCLRDNEAKLSDGCRDAIERPMRHRGYKSRSCNGDDRSEGPRE